MEKASLFLSAEQQYAVILCNAPDAKTARAIAQELVTHKIVACVNILPCCCSIYQWNGKMQEETETPMLMKTQTSRLDAVVETIRRIHPYDTPEIIALPMIGGAADYLQWVAAQT